MRPRVRGHYRPAPNPPHGSSGISTPPPTEPVYRWTLTTWIHKRWRDYRGWHEKDMDQRTVTVLAPSEAVAKQKVEAALPPMPADVKSEWRDGDQEEYTRHWALGATVEEVGA